MPKVMTMRLGDFVTPAMSLEVQPVRHIVESSVRRRKLRAARTTTIVSALVAVDLAILVATVVGLTLFVRWAF